jgi:hypothetical protein
MRQLEQGPGKVTTALGDMATREAGIPTRKANLIDSVIEEVSSTIELFDRFGWEVDLAPDVLIHNETTYVLFAPDLGNPTLEQVAPCFQDVLPSPDVLPEDVANAVPFLAADESKWTTGVTLTVDRGNYTK